MTALAGGNGGFDAPERARFARAKALFCEAVDRPDAERPAFLAGACGGDEALRAEVESLLASDRQAAGFIEVPAVELLAGPSIATGSGDSGRGEPAGSHAGNGPTATWNPHRVLCRRVAARQRRNGRGLPRP